MLKLAEFFCCPEQLLSMKIFFSHVMNDLLTSLALDWPLVYSVQTLLRLVHSFCQDFGPSSQYHPHTCSALN